MVDFSNRTVVCIGSGPSLTPEDCEKVKASGHRIIAINNSWALAPFADAIYAGDYEWWRHNQKDITSSAEQWTCSHYAHSKLGVNLHRIRGVEWHSGLRAVQFAEEAGATRVILLGYDCSVDKGVHWHGVHSKTTNPNAGKCSNWRAQFRLLAARTKIEIINCSRQTALNCFPTAHLEDALCLKHFPAETHRKTSMS